MAHFAKYTRGQCFALFRHYERAKNEETGEYIKFSNWNINSRLTGFNYNLAPEQHAPQHAIIRKRLSEVKCQKREDVNVMCSWVVTLPKTFAEENEKSLFQVSKGKLRKDSEKFFKHTYNYLEKEYGRENVISAYVHMDEEQPHMHFSFIPVVEDEKRGGLKVSCKELINRNILRQWHTRYSDYMTKCYGRDIGVLNEATKDGNMTVAELKAVRVRDKLNEHRQERDALLTEFKELRENIASSKHEILHTQEELIAKNKELEETEGSINYWKAVKEFLKHPKIEPQWDNFVNLWLVREEERERENAEYNRPTGRSRGRSRTIERDDGWEIGD